jgi:hypothetical protein
MTGREQLVWASSYASQASDPANAIRLANQAVYDLRRLDIDNERYSGPEYEATRNGPGLTLEEFSAWYPIALKIAKKGLVTPNEVTEAACQEAFETYRRSASDFY